MNEKNENIVDEFLPHITLETYDDIKKKKVSGGYNSNFNSKPISEDNFKNMILDALSVGNVKSNSFDNSYFLMDLTSEYYSSSVTAMMNDLELEVKTVLNDFQVIVKANPLAVRKYLQRKKQFQKK